MEECVDPGVLTLEDLLAYATGESDGRTSAHIDGCAACARQVQEYATLDASMRRSLFRADCPPSQVLGELALSVLQPEEELAVRSHIALCHHCTGELRMLYESLRADPLANLMRGPSPLARVIARLMPSPGLSGAAAAVRGADQSAELAYQSDRITISLAIEAAGSRSERRWTILGLVVDEEKDAIPIDVPVWLLTESRVVSQTVLDQWGNFSLADLPGGTHTLELDLNDRTIAIEGLNIGDA